MLALDGWGIQLISQCRLAMIKAITAGVKIKLLLATQCLGNENLASLPEDIDLKIGNVTTNVIIVDSSNMVVVDSSNGKAALFVSIDIFGLSQLRSFETEWNNALEVRGKYTTKCCMESKQVSQNPRECKYPGTDI